MGDDRGSKDGGRWRVLRMHIAGGAFGRQLLPEPRLLSFLFSSLQKPGIQVKPMRSGDT